MTDSIEGDPSGSVPPARRSTWPVVPTVAMPPGIGTVAGAALVGAAALAILAVGILAMTLSLEAPPEAFGSFPDAPGPPISLVDRLATFTQGGRGNLFWAVMLALGVLIIAISGREATDDRQGDRGPRRVVVAAVALAGIVALADLAMCLVILARVDVNAFATGFVGTNRPARVVELLAPATLSWGVVWYGVEWLRSRKRV